MIADCSTELRAMRVDGGMAANDWLCQFIANILAVPVERPVNLETTALGAAFHAGLATGVWSGLDDLPDTFAEARRFEPRMAGAERERLVAGWKDAVARTLSSHS
jgi:glycerol kinase